MAKKYTDFEFVPAGSFKPEGTLGRHCCTVVPQNDHKVVIGSVRGVVTIKPGDILGYDCGTVWLVPHPDSYKDPIRRILALAKINQRTLEYSNDAVPYVVSYEDTTDWCEGSAADPSTGEDVSVFGQYDQTCSESESGVSGTRYQITGGKVIVVRKVVKRITAFERPRRVTRVIVRPEVKDQVERWLYEELVQEGRSDRLRRNSLTRLCESQGIEASTSITDLYSRLSAVYESDAQMAFQGVVYKIHRDIGCGGDVFSWTLADGTGPRYEDDEMNLAWAFKTGLLQAWVSQG